MKTDYGSLPDELEDKIFKDAIENKIRSDIRDEMDADMESSGMAQGEIESCLNHWNNKYTITRK